MSVSIDSLAQSLSAASGNITLNVVPLGKVETIELDNSGRLGEPNDISNTAIATKINSTVIPANEDVTTGGDITITSGSLTLSNSGFQLHGDKDA